MRLNPVHELYLQKRWRKRPKTTRVLAALVLLAGWPVVLSIAIYGAMRDQGWRDFVEAMAECAAIAFLPWRKEQSDAED